MIDRVFSALAMTSIALLAFLAGGFLILAQWFPYEPLRNAYLAGKALLEQRHELGNAYATDLWNKAPGPQRGVVVADQTRMQPGYTLYTSAHTQAAFLLAPDGKVVHAWSMPYSQIWDRSAATQTPVADNRTYFRDVRLLPNGDLLAIYDGVGDTLYGYGLIKLDQDSQLVWKYLQHVHHAIDVMPNGNLLTLTQAITTDEVTPPLNHLKPPRIDDYVVELSPAGTPIREVRVLDALARSDYTRLTDALPGYLGDTGDYLHTNDVDYIDADTARHFPFAQPGQVLLSLRELGALAVLDLDSRRITWAMRGFWVGQHDPDLLPNGHLLLFDNNGHFGAGRSQVVEFSPNTLQVFWRYTGDAQQPLESVIRSSQQRLANGNTLITESDKGRLLEVSPSGDIVWEFINPIRAGMDGNVIPIISSGQRIDPEQLTPEFRRTLETASGGRTS